MSSTAPIFTKLAMTERHSVDILLTEIYPNNVLWMWILRVIIYLWHWEKCVYHRVDFRETHVCLTTFQKGASVQNFMKTRETG